MIRTFFSISDSNWFWFTFPALVLSSLLFLVYILNKAFLWVFYRYRDVREVIHRRRHNKSIFLYEMEALRKQNQNLASGVKELEKLKQMLKPIYDELLSYQQNLQPDTSRMFVPWGNPCTFASYNDKLHKVLGRIIEVRPKGIISRGVLLAQQNSIVEISDNAFRTQCRCYKISDKELGVKDIIGLMEIFPEYPYAIDEIDDTATYEFHVNYDAIPRHLKLHLDVVGSRTKKWFVRENDIALLCLTSSIELAYRALTYQVSFYYDHSNLETIEFVSTSDRTNKLTKRLNKYVEKKIYKAEWYKEKFKETEEQPQK